MPVTDFKQAPLNDGSNVFKNIFLRSLLANATRLILKGILLT